MSVHKQFSIVDPIFDIKVLLGHRTLSHLVYPLGWIWAVRVELGDL